MFYILGRICKKLQLTSSNSTLQEILPLMGQYEIQNSSILTQESEQITYYNSEKQTYLVSAINLENESQGVWMVRHFQDHYMAEYYR